jgi:N6-adenosine-specific RNA methylase IME4
MKQFKFHRFSNIFPMIEGNELEQLKIDIKEQGLLQPIVLFEDQILDGRNRYIACKDLDIEPKFEEYKGNKPLEYVISGNLKRRHLTPDQRAVLSLNILPMLEEEAKKRMSAGGRGDEIVTPSKSREQASKLMNVGTTYIQQAKKLKETSPKLLEEVRLGHKNFSQIKKEERFEKIKKQREEIKKLIPSKILKQEYDVIVIDPPWKYDGDIFKEQEDGLPIFNYEGMRGTTPYPTMSIEEIKNIKLPSSKDCVLWLWTTNLFIHYAFHIIEHWGFEPKSILTWDKQHIGTGRWLRSQTEHCILAIKGNPLFVNTKYSTLLSEMKTKIHSEKPEGFYKILDDIHKECAKLDYFARKKREGWDAYGDEIRIKEEFLKEVIGNGRKRKS